MLVAMSTPQSQAAAPQGKTASQLEAEADPTKMPEGLDTTISREELIDLTVQSLPALALAAVGFDAGPDLGLLQSN